VPQWVRIAVVTDTGWIRHTINALRFLIPGDIRVFATVHAQEGRDWITSQPTVSRELLTARRLDAEQAPSQ
jgi:hypothetical protein